MQKLVLQAITHLNDHNFDKHTSLNKVNQTINHFMSEPCIQKSVKISHDFLHSFILKFFKSLSCQKADYPENHNVLEN